MSGPMVDANHASAGCDGRTGSIQMGKVKGKRMKSLKIGFNEVSHLEKKLLSKTITHYESAIISTNKVFHICSMLYFFIIISVP